MWRVIAQVFKLQKREKDDRSFILKLTYSLGVGCAFLFGLTLHWFVMITSGVTVLAWMFGALAFYGVLYRYTSDFCALNMAEVMEMAARDNFKQQMDDMLHG